jgi:tetratricopeptide (TPR) repeat protein
MPTREIFSYDLFVARSYESLWLWLGAGFVAVGAALLGVAGVFDAASRVPYSFFTSAPVIVGSVLFGLSLACFVCAIREVPIPYPISGRKTELLVSPVEKPAPERPASLDPPGSGIQVTGGLEALSIAGPTLAAEASGQAGPHEVLMPSADPPRRIRSGRQAWPIIDREAERSALRGRLADGPFGVVVVNGLAGVGKSKVLDTVLDQMLDDSRAGSPALVVRRTVDAATRLDLKTFIDLLDDGTVDPARVRGNASLARLEAVLSGLGDRPVILAVDAAENLLKPGTQGLADLDLDEALEFLTTEPDHRVSVVLAFRRPPTSPTGGTWPDVNGAIPVPQLKMAEFFDYLQSLDRIGALGLEDLDEAFRRRLHQHLQGNPRHAELVYALVTTVDTCIGLHDLADEVFRCRPQEVSERLTRLLAERLGPTRRRVLEALAAFGTPVHGEAVVSALTAEHAASDVRQALAVLSDDRVAYRRDDGEYFLPDPQANIFLRRMDIEARSNLLAGAAEELYALRPETVTGVLDLRIPFAELNALIRAGQHRSAYRVIESIDDYLRKWNCSYLLNGQRTDVRAKLDDDHLEMANENALAGIHVSRREFQAAAEAYQKALDRAIALDDRAGKLKIHLNRAAMYLADNRIRPAQDLFQLVIDDPDRVNDLSLRMGALEGLADCHRREGRYDEAIRSAKLAQDLPQLTGFPDTRSAAEFSATRMVLLSLKLARWYTELGDLKGANHWMNAADVTAAADEWLRLACLDGRADLLLAEGHIAAAIAMAREAVDHALATQDQITLLRARTTLCVAHLRTGQMREARREIERAARFRRPGHSLLVLALHALVTRHAGDPEAADGLFRRLEDESRRRLGADDDDFAARDLLGLAISGRALSGNADLSDAVECFRAAREQTPPTPGLVERLRTLLEVLDSSGPGPGLLRPAIDALGGAAGPGAGVGS